MTDIKQIKKALSSIKKMDDSCERLGYEISETISGTFPGEIAEDYRTIGKDLLNLMFMHPNELEIINDTLIAITGWSIPTIKDRMKKHKSLYDNL